MAKSLLYVAGSGLAIGGIAFVGVELNTYADELDLSQFGSFDWAFLVFLSGAYGAGNLFLAWAWWQLLILCGGRADLLLAVRIYSQSQLAKYVPGNIFHLAGRQALGMASGIAGAPLVKSSVCELSLMSLVGATFAALVLPLVWNDLPMVGAGLIFSLVVLIAISVLGPLVGRAVVYAFTWHLMFLSLSGLVFFGVLSVVVDPAHLVPSWAALCGAYVVAWLGGLLTPGAPAGIGVREAVLVFLLGASVASADLLLAVLLVRMVTVVGDILFFLGVSLVMPATSTT